VDWLANGEYGGAASSGSLTGNLLPGGEAVRSNPFTYGNPISDPRRFFGRAREVDQIFGRLRNEEFESSSLVGDRRIGKTSLLNYLADHGVRAAQGLGPERYNFVYVDLQMLDEAMGPEHLWRRLLVLMRRH
jgi:serine/threonine-protein kinase